MYKVQKTIYLMVIAMILGCLSGCATRSTAETTEPETFHPVDSSFSASDLEVGYDESDATQITCMNATAQITGSGAEIADGVITITQGGMGFPLPAKTAPHSGSSRLKRQLFCCLTAQKTR